MFESVNPTGSHYSTARFSQGLAFGLAIAIRRLEHKRNLIFAQSFIREMLETEAICLQRKYPQIPIDIKHKLNRFSQNLP